MNWHQRGSLLAVLASCLAGCASIPQSAEEGVVEIKNVTAAIECELAAVAADPRFKDRQLQKWKSLSDLDLTFQTGFGVDGQAGASWPYTNALLTVSPSLGGNRKDTSISHVQFATPIAKALETYGASCSGPDPSDTRMGLAEWFRSALLAIDKGSITGLTFTKEFEIAAKARARFGYTIIPVTNAIDAGGGASHDRIHRVSIALAPGHGPAPPIAVYVVGEAEAAPHKDHVAEKRAGAEKGTTARDHAVHDQTLQSLLQRRAPIKLLP
jgi:hypothetical protein